MCKCNSNDIIEELIDFEEKVESNLDKVLIHTKNVDAAYVEGYTEGFANSLTDLKLLLGDIILDLEERQRQCIKS